LKEAGEDLEERKEGTDNESEKEHLQAMIDGLAVASLKSGSDWPLSEESRPPSIINQLLQFLGGFGFSDYELLQSFKEPTSPNTRLRMYDALQKAPPQSLLDVSKGDPSLESYAEVLSDPKVDPSLKPFIRDTLIDSTLDDAMIWDYAVRDFLSANKDTALTSKDIKAKGKALTKKMSENSPTVEQLIEMAGSGGDLESMKNDVRLLRMDSMKKTLEDAGADLGKSSPGIALRDAVEEKNPSIVQIKQVPSFDQRLSHRTFDQSSFYKFRINSVKPKKQCPFRASRRNSMKKLSKKGAENLVLAIEKVATAFEEDWEILGLDKAAARDLAYRLDVASDVIDRTAGCGDHGRTTDIPLSALKNEGETGGPRPGDFDPGTISEVHPQGALESQPDEPYMKGNFTEQESSELAYRQQNNKLENSKCATSKKDRIAAELLDSLVNRIEDVVNKFAAEEEEEEKEASKEEEGEEKKASSDYFNLYA
jgi:hypothetical protein